MITSKIRGARHPILAVVTAFSLSAAAPIFASEVISFGDFSGPTSQSLIDLNGAAAFTDGRLRLAPNEPSQAGSAFLSLGGQGLFINPTSDFSTTFRYQISGDGPAQGDTSGRSDGFTFLVQGVGPDYLGDAGANLGYIGGSRPGPGNFGVYAVEFDTHANSPGQFDTTEPPDPDVSDSEIAITRYLPNGVLDVLATRDTTGRFLIDDGAERTVTIDYNQHGQDRRLRVFVDGSLLLAHTLPTELFPFGGRTFLGFSAATGDGFADHDILEWSVSIPEPSALALVGIAIAATSITRRRNPAGSQ